MPPRHGFTRIDVLVLCVVLFLGSGMTLTARSRNEQSSNRSKTINNLKQIGLAFQNYNDQQGYLPNNGGATAAADLKAVNYGWHSPNVRDSGTWATQILPFIEQGPLFSNVVFAGVEPPGLPETYPADKDWKVEVKTYLCYERARKGYKTSKDKGCYPGPVTDFAINIFLHSQPNFYSAAGYGQGEMKDGLNGDWTATNTKITVGTIPDGTSNTIFVGEKALPPALAKKNINFENDETIAYTNAPVPKNADEGTEAKSGDEGIFSPGNWCFVDGKKVLVSTGTARGQTVVKNPPAAAPKEHPADGGVPWLYQDSELTGDKLPPYHLAFGSPYQKGVPFMFGDGTVRIINYNQKGTPNLARMLYPADGQTVTFDD